MVVLEVSYDTLETLILQFYKLLLYLLLGFYIYCTITNVEAIWQIWGEVV